MSVCRVPDFTAHSFLITSGVIPFRKTGYLILETELEKLYSFSDMINMLKLEFTPSTGEWIHPVSDPQHTLAVADSESPKIYLFDGHGTNTPLHVLDSIHTKPVTIIKVRKTFVLDCCAL